ncbi:MAG: PTS N-acetylmuramic acid transporter subunit IIBC [Culicoidibacterales bacterium]
MNTRNEQLIKGLGGVANIADIQNCVTRLRIKVIDQTKVNLIELQAVEGAMGAVDAGNQIQVIFGPGVQQIKTAFEEYVNQIKVADMSLDDIAKIEKQKQKVEAGNKTGKGFQSFMNKFSEIFVPLIPGFIAAGLLAGFGTLFSTIALQVYGKNVPLFITQTVAFMSIFNKGLLYFLPILIGYNASKAFGGSGVVGAIIGSLFLVVYGAPILDETTGKATATLISGVTKFYNVSIESRGGVVGGGIIGVLISSIISGYVEAWFQKHTWKSIAIFWPATITLIVMSIFTFLVVMPVSSILYGGMTQLFITLNGNPFGAAVLSGLFLTAVLFGIHQGFVPVYQGLVSKVGYNTLFPILAMAGASQVGAAIALYVKADKGSQVRKMIRGAIVPGFLGIGEPLIYGITLPRVKPFVTACIGGALGGFFVGTLAYFGFDFGLNTVFGPSGLLALPLMTSKNGVFVGIALYFLSLCVSYVAGFIVTYFFGTKKVNLD